MNEKPRIGWLVIALILGVWLCMIVTVTSVIFTTHTDGELTRVRGCRAFGEPIWHYVDEAEMLNHQSVTSMSQEALATHEYSCSIT
jgi:hypothetical protein